MECGRKNNPGLAVSTLAGQHCLFDSADGVLKLVTGKTYRTEEAGRQTFGPAEASPRKILLMGLPGAGKTTLAKVLAPKLKAVLFNADAVRQNLNKDLGFSLEHRIEQARRMGWLCDRVTEAGYVAVADFVCPTPETRAAFGPAFIVWVDRISKSRFEDTNLVFVPPRNFQIQVTPEGSPELWAERVQGAFDQWSRRPSENKSF